MTNRGSEIGKANMKKPHPDFETRMMWKGQTGLPMNVAIDNGYAYDVQQLPFIQVAFQMDTDDHGNMDNWNDMGLDAELGWLMGVRKMTQGAVLAEM